MGLARHIAKWLCYRCIGAVASMRGAARPARSSESFGRVLLCEISLLGDAVSFTATLPVARRFWPRARIDALVRREYVPLLATGLHLDGILQLHDMSAASFARCVRAARRRSYDLVVSMSPGLRNATAALLASSGASAGYLVDRGLPPHFLNKQRLDGIGIRLASEFTAGAGTHIVDRSLGVLRALGAEVPEGAAPEIDVASDARDAAARWLARADLRDGRFVAIHPHAGERRRRWPMNRFVAVAEQIEETTGLAAVWLGSRSDRWEIERATRGKARHILRGRPLGEVAAVLERAALFIGNDSGPMHLAGALGIPLVGIFGPGDPARLLPRNANAAAVGGPDHGGDVARVTIDEVMSAAQRVLSTGGAR